MSESVVIIGASGHGKVIADIILKSGDSIQGFLDDNKELGDSFIGYPILGNVRDYKKYLDCKFIIAIGNADIRERIVNKLSDAKWYTAIHPTAVISLIGVKIGEGTVIMANSVINSCSCIGKHCILNTSSVIEHDNQVDDFVHTSVASSLAGSVKVGKKTWIGTGATVSNNITICEECYIGAGAVVVKDINKKGTYVGVPAKMIKE